MRVGLLDGLPSVRDLFSNVGNTPPNPEQASTKPPVDRPPQGASGRSHFNGFIQWDEFNPEWIGANGLRLADRMWRTDSDIKRDTLATWTPISAASWTVEPYGGDKATDQDLYAAELCTYALWEYMRPNLVVHLSEVGPILLRSGYVDFEQIWKSTTYHGKQVILPKKLDLRLPRTIWKFYQDDDGELTGIVQFLPNAANVFISATELLHYRIQAEGDNWVGTSMYRHAWKHFYYKEKLEALDAIGQERKAVGVPVVYPPQGASEEAKEDMETLLANLHTNEVGFIIMPGPKAGPNVDPNIGWEVEIITFDSSSSNGIRESIDQQTLKIAGAFIADFLELGHHQVGARATADVQEDPFMTSVKALGELVTIPLNDLCARIATLNVPGIEGSPKLNMSLHDEASLSEISSYALQLYQADLLVPDAKLEDYFRERADFPPADPEVRAETEEAQKAGRQLAIQGGQPQEQQQEPNELGNQPVPPGTPPGGKLKAGSGKPPVTGNTPKAPPDGDRAKSPGSKKDPHEVNNGPKKPSQESLKLDAASAVPGGAMVALYPLPDVAHALALDGGELPEDLHVTLVYLGSAADIEDSDKLRAVVAGWAASTPPVKANTAGLGVFTPSAGSDFKPVTYATVDAPHLSHHRDHLAHTLKRAGFNVADAHGFVPHLTLAYADRRNAVVPPTPLSFSHATLAIGGEQHHFPLTGDTEVKLDAAPEPPNYRAADKPSEHCGNCHMFTNGVCWGYGNRPVEADHVCDSWEMTQQTRTLDAPSAAWYEELLSQGRLKEALDGARESMETATRAPAVKLAALTAARARSGRRIAVAAPPADLLAAFEDEIGRLYDIGYQTVADELAKQHKQIGTPPVLAVPSSEPDASEDAPTPGGQRRKRVHRRALIAAEHVTNEVARVTERSALGGTREPLALQRSAEAAARGAIRKEALTNASPSINDGRRDAAVAAGLALAAAAVKEPEAHAVTGRTGVAEGVPQLRGIYTAVLDPRTCDSCFAADDGMERDPDDPALQVPNPECSGGEYCRCTVVWVLAGENGALVAPGEE